MGEKIPMTFDVLMGWVETGRQQHGDEYAAQWLLEEFRRQPVPLMHLLLGVAKDRAAELDYALAVVRRADTAAQTNQEVRSEPDAGRAGRNRHPDRR